jgi:hypothetical protein
LRRPAHGGRHFDRHGRLDRCDVSLKHHPSAATATILRFVVGASNQLGATKQTCASVARIYDTQVQLIRGQGEHISLLLKILAGGTIGLGLLLGPIFLFIYFATRKHVAIAAARTSAL